MKIGIIVADSNGKSYVPAVKGGAVTTLVEQILSGLNETNICQTVVYCYYNEEAEKASWKYKNIIFNWVKIPKIINALDVATYWAIKVFLRKKKAISFKSLWSLVFFVIKCSKEVKRRKFDKIIIENNVPSAWIIKKSHYSGEYYYHFHNIPRIDAKARSVFDSCTGYLCVSKYVARAIQSNNCAIGQVPSEKCKILYNCIDFEKFDIDRTRNEEIRKNYGLQNDDKVVIFAGRISYEKGLDVLLDAIPLVKHDIKVLVVGSLMHGQKEKDDYLTSVQNKAEKIGKNIVFTGYVEQSDMRYLYNASDIAVLPSMWEEPAGLTMIEAMACGVPVITTNSGGIPEYSGEKSIILKRDEHLKENIAWNIDEILDNPFTYDTEAARLFVQSNFNTKEYAKRFLEVIS